MRAKAAAIAGEAPGQLMARARKGTHAVFATRLLSVVCSAASITILARLIPPEQFGVWAMAIVPLGLMTLVRELGLVYSIVQASNLAPGQKDAYFWTSIAVSLAAAALLALAAPLLSTLYGAPLLRPVIWLCCLSLAVSGLGLVHAALLRRGLQYDRLVIVEGGGMVCGVVASVVAAFAWRDVWALVAGHVASAVWMTASALILCRWMPGVPHGKWAQIDLSFSRQVTFSNVLNFAGNNIGLVVGFRFPAVDLGFFNRGQSLFNLANFAFLTPMTEVGFALLCRLKSDDSYRQAYVALLRRVAVLFIPCAVLLPIVAGDVVHVLLGPAWAATGPILAWFAPAVFAQAFTTVCAQLMMSQGRGGELRNLAAVDLLVRAAGAMLGSHFGIAGMAAGFSAASFAISAPLMAFIGSRRGPVRLGDQFTALWPGVALAIAAAAGAAASLVAANLLGLDAGWARLFFVAGSAAVAWTALCILLRPARDALLGRELAHA